MTLTSSQFHFTDNNVKGLYQGDIVVNPKQEQAMEPSAVRGLGNGLWPGGVVYHTLCHVS